MSEQPTSTELTGTRQDRYAAIPTGAFVAAGDYGLARSDLADLTEARLLRAITADLWWRGEIRDTRFGRHHRPPSHEAILAALGARWWGYGGYSALNLLGLSTQIPRAACVAAGLPAPVEVDRQLSLMVEVADKPWRVGLNPLEVTLLEVLADMDRVELGNTNGDRVGRGPGLRAVKRLLTNRHPTARRAGVVRMPLLRAAVTHEPGLVAEALTEALGSDLRRHD